MSELSERFVICEGREDVAFVRELGRVHQFPAFTTSPIGEGKTGEGIDGLLAHLKHVIGLTGFRQRVRHVVLLADSEADQDKTFNKIVSDIRNANGATDVDGFFAEPKKVFKTRKGTHSTFTVVLLPTNRTAGCLETLLFSYLIRNYPNETKCIEVMIKCAGLDKAKWTLAKLDKARLRAAIGIIYKDNPNCSTRFLWERDGVLVHPKKQLIPLSEPEFTEVSGLLAGI